MTNDKTNNNAPNTYKPKQSNVEKLIVYLKSIGDKN